MLLLIDAGNTRIKWALMPLQGLQHAPLGEWAASGSVPRQEARALGATLRQYSIARVLLSNVAGRTVREELESMLSGVLGLKPVPLEWFCSVPELAGVRNRYRQPGQLGCDRFASAIGAHALFPGEPLIVATCGTATTVDAVSAQGDFLGGMILPGLGLMASALAQNTAQLPEVVADLALRQPFADHTEAAIVSGCLAAQAGAIERAVAAHAAAQPDDAAVRVVLSGGAAPYVAPQLSVPVNQVEKLVLIGLQAAARQHKPC